MDSAPLSQGQIKVEESKSALKSSDSQAHRRASAAFSLQAYARTGNYGYLCHAASLGSPQALEELKRLKFKCNGR
ncbi:MAG: hypothetical protein LBV23_03950 [Deltaproteobacteria bacterium]|nr:hypothetical protein [Deltaproteobacteria bacterium]